MDFGKFAEQGFDLSGEEKIETGDDFISNAVLPYIVDKKAWDNYTDDVIYDADKRIRAWMEEMSKDSKWVHSTKLRRYRYTQLFRILYGREYDTKKDAGYTYKLRRVFAYYSTSIRTAAKDDDGKWVAKPAFVISSSRLKNPPYSLRLRFEKFADEGIIPDSYNMAVPKDNLATGHARNPKTDAAMQKRREQKRERYNEYQRARNSRLSEGSDD